MGDQHRATRVIEREIPGNCRDGEDNPGHSLRPEVSLTEISPRAIIQFAWLFTNLKLPSPKVLISRVTVHLPSSFRDRFHLSAIGVYQMEGLRLRRSLYTAPQKCRPFTA
jgi:hypothetical protein